MTKSKIKEKKLLIVEDDPGLRKQLKWGFSDYKIFVAEDCESALRELQNNKPPVITLDLGLPPDPTNARVGLETLEQIIALEPKTKVIVVTGNDEKENALKAIALGAYDFYQKPVEPEILTLIVERAHRLYELERENEKLNELTCPLKTVPVIKLENNLNWTCKEVDHAKKTLQTRRNHQAFATS